MPQLIWSLVVVRLGELAHWAERVRLRDLFKKAAACTSGEYGAPNRAELFGSVLMAFHL